MWGNLAMRPHNNLKLNIIIISEVDESLVAALHGDDHKLKYAERENVFK